MFGMFACNCVHFLFRGREKKRKHETAQQDFQRKQAKLLSQMVKGAVLTERVQNLERENANLKDAASEKKVEEDCIAFFS